MNYFQPHEAQEKAGIHDLSIVVKLSDGHGFSV